VFLVSDWTLPCPRDIALTYVWPSTQTMSKSRT